MTTQSTGQTSGGIGVCGLLLVIFIIAKVFEIGPVAAWSWWWVFSPMWIPALIVAGMVVFFAVLALVAKVIE